MAAYVAFGNPRGKFHPQSASTRFPLWGPLTRAQRTA